MRTRLTIMAIVLAAASAAVGILALLVVLLGWPGLAIDVAGATAVVVVYRVLVQPWQHRWGATDEEVGRAMPGDDLLPVAASTTRAVSVAAPSEQVWPWLLQIGYGRAGWYSYDWIDTTATPAPTASSPSCRSLGSATRSRCSRGWDPGCGRSSPTGTWSAATTTAAPGAWRCIRPRKAAGWSAAGG